MTDKGFGMVWGEQAGLGIIVPNERGAVSWQQWWSLVEMLTEAPGVGGWKYPQTALLHYLVGGAPVGSLFSKSKLNKAWNTVSVQKHFSAVERLSSKPGQGSVGVVCDLRALIKAC